MFKGIKVIFRSQKEQTDKGKTAATTEFTRTHAVWNNRGHPWWSEQESIKQSLQESIQNETDALSLTFIFPTFYTALVYNSEFHKIV